MTGVTNLTTGLTTLVDQVRGVTIRILEVTPPALLTWTPHGTSNHILWHAGHALWVADVLTIEPITGHGELPTGCAEMFGEGARPATVTNWPAAVEVRELLQKQRDRVTQLLTTHADAIAARANEHIAQNGWPLLTGIIHGWHDEARHQGEMHLLKKLYNRTHAS
jgi:hypothetical protein